jgi:hypothetical protein
MNYANSILFGGLCLIFLLTSVAWGYLSLISYVRRSTQIAECDALLTRLELKLSDGAVLKMRSEEGPIYRTCRQATNEERY